MADAAACPVAALAREAARLLAAHRAVDEAGSGVRPYSAEHTALTWRAELILDRLRAVEAEAAQRRATSVAGAMFQVMLAGSEAGCAASYHEDRWDAVVDEHERAVRGLLYSVLAVIEDLGGVPRGAVLADWYMSRRYDPHRALEAALEDAGEPEPAQ
jgi:hypothetical protein